MCNLYSLLILRYDFADASVMFAPPSHAITASSVENLCSACVNGCGLRNDGRSSSNWTRHPELCPLGKYPVQQNP